MSLTFSSRIEKHDFTTSTQAVCELHKYFIHV